MCYKLVFISVQHKLDGTLKPFLSGTSFLKKSDLQHHYLFSDVDWKLIFSIAFNSCKVIEAFSLKTFITVM